MRIALEHRVFSVPSPFRGVSLDRLDISPRILSLLKKRGFRQLGDFDSVSHVEFRRYFRGFPSPTDVLEAVDRSINKLLDSLESSASERESGERSPKHTGMQDGEQPSVLLASPKGNTQSRIQELNEYGSVAQPVLIYIPVEHRGRSITAYNPSVRLRHVLHQAGIRVLGQLHGRTVVEFGEQPNCGKKTINELEQLVRRVQGIAEMPQMSSAAEDDPNVLTVSQSVRTLSLCEIPMSKRLENVLSERGWRKLGDLDGINTAELLETDNFGQKTLWELKRLLARAHAGEFTAEPSILSIDPLISIIRFIDAGMRGLSERDREIAAQRLLGEAGGFRTLEDVGEQFGITRERVRQIVKAGFEKVRRSGGPILARALEALAKEHIAFVIPVSAPLIGERLSKAQCASEWPPVFYMYVLDQITPSIPVWGIGDRTGKSR